MAEYSLRTSKKTDGVWIKSFLSVRSDSYDLESEDDAVKTERQRVHDYLHSFVWDGKPRLADLLQHHPVRDFPRALVWDGTPRLDRFKVGT